jgi:ABC-type uncharacterized transport system involved in gliding motility auxiliary subunit
MASAVVTLSRVLPALAIGALLCALNLWAVRHPRRWDLTSARLYSVGPETERVLSTIQRPVRITFFYDLRSKAMQDAKRLLEQYARSSPHIQVEAVDPMLQPERAMREQVTFAGTTDLESEGRRVIVNGNTETEFTNALLRVSSDVTQEICFTDGHLESDPLSFKTHDHFDGASDGHSHSAGGRRLEVHERHGMGMAKDALEALGYRVRKVLLLQGPAVLQGCSVVVVASPQEAFTNVEETALRDYLRGGGSAVVMLEPFTRSRLGLVLSDFGIVAGSALVVDESQHYWTDPSTPAVTEYSRHKITRNVALTFYPGAVALRPLPTGVPDGISVHPLVETTTRATEGKEGPVGSKTLMVLATRRLEDGGPQGSGRRSPSLIVFGDGDFASNSFFHLLGNGALFLNSVSHLAGQESLVDIMPRGYAQPSLQLTNQQMQLTFLVSTVLLPMLLLGVGVAVWWQRR